MATGGCKHAKATQSALGNNLYLAVDELTRYLLDHAIETGILDLKPDVTDPLQCKMIDTFISIVAEDTPTESVQRLVSMLQNVHNCTRKYSESSSTYARWFKGRASLYLNNCSKRNFMQDTQLFAMILLKNIRLPEITLNYIILQLISEASLVTRKTPEILSIKRTSLVYLRNELSVILDSVSSDNGTVDDAWSSVSLSVNHLDMIYEDTGVVRNQESTMLPKISLDAATRRVSEVIVSVPGESHNSTEVAPRATLGSMLGKRHYGSDDRKRQIPRGEGPKASSPCCAYGKVGHWWKD
ncbi:unnamed protein product [Agarophyton chilense]